MKPSTAQTWASIMGFSGLFLGFTFAYSGYRAARTLSGWLSGMAGPVMIVGAVLFGAGLVTLAIALMIGAQGEMNRRMLEWVSSIGRLQHHQATLAQQSAPPAPPAPSSPQP